MQIEVKSFFAWLCFWVNRVCKFKDLAFFNETPLKSGDLELIGHIDACDSIRFVREQMPIKAGNRVVDNIGRAVQCRRKQENRL